MKPESFLAGIVVGLGAFLLAPVIAPAIGLTGLLGAAGTGVSIMGLSGAALTSASLAAIGGGVLAGKIVIGGVAASAAASFANYCIAVENDKVAQASQYFEDLKRESRTDFENLYKEFSEKMTEKEKVKWLKHLSKKA